MALFLDSDNFIKAENGKPERNFVLKHNKMSDWTSEERREFGLGRLHKYDQGED